MRLHFAALTAVGIASCLAAGISLAAPLWTELDGARIAPLGERQIIPNKSRTMALNFVGMRQLLESASREQDVAVPDSRFEVELPLPEGGMARFLTQPLENRITTNRRLPRRFS